VLIATQLNLYRVFKKQKKTIKFKTNPALPIVTAFTHFSVSVNVVHWVQNVILTISVRTLTVSEIFDFTLNWNFENLPQIQFLCCGVFMDRCAKIAPLLILKRFHLNAIRKRIKNTTKWAKTVLSSSSSYPDSEFQKVVAVLNGAGNHTGKTCQRIFWAS